MPPLPPLHIRRENITRAAHGLDQARMLGIGLDLPAQPRDQIVYGPVERRPVLAFQQVHDVIARQHAVRPFDEGFEKVELAGGEIAGFAGRANQTPAADIEDPALELKVRRRL
jgi:hypothetical protein